MFHKLAIDEASASAPAYSTAHITPQVAGLATGILAAGKIPRKAATDAAHIAIAAAHGMDFPVTRNCVHIANAAIAKALAFICREHACECPVICTPEELMGE